MRITVKHLTADYLRSILHYDPLTGIFTWKVATRGHRAGMTAGSVTGNGYVYITIDGVQYAAGRLAYLYMQGQHVEPHLEIDHRNNIKTDNRWENLRPLTHQQNIASYYKSKAPPPRSRRQPSLMQPGDPFGKMRQFVADNAASLEIAQLRAEQCRRKKANSQS